MEKLMEKDILEEMRDTNKCPICGKDMGKVGVDNEPMGERLWFYSVPPDIACYQHTHHLGLVFPAGLGDWDAIREHYGLKKVGDYKE